MAMNEGQNTQRSYKELKKMAKEQKKAKKKEKKKGKLEKKIAKKEAKMRKKGVFLDEVVTPEAPSEEKPEEFVVQPWVRKSTETVPYVERKIDRMAARTERSRLHDLFEEKYGESLVVPVTYKEYELSEAEKARLKELGVGVEETRVSPAIEVAPMGAAEIEPSEPGEVETGEEVAKVEGAPKPFYHPLNLWLYNKYGKDKMIVLKILILIVSILGFIVLFLPRVVIFIIMLIVNKIKQRKAKKAKANETAQTATKA